MRGLADYLQDYSRRGGESVEGIESVVNRNILPVLCSVMADENIATGRLVRGRTTADVRRKPSETARKIWRSCCLPASANVRSPTKQSSNLESEARRHVVAKHCQRFANEIRKPNENKRDQSSSDSSGFYGLFSIPSLAHNGLVGGSSPPGPTIFILHSFDFNRLRSDFTNRSLRFVTRCSLCGHRERFTHRFHARPCHPQLISGGCVSLNLVQALVSANRCYDVC